MEINPGRGKLTNVDQKRLEDTGCVECRALKKCWSNLADEEFDTLILMLQSFCLVYPLRDPCDKSSWDKPNQDYLIPSKLIFTEFDEALKTNFSLSFTIDFCGFLPDEVYHRFLCLMIKESKFVRGTSQYTAQHFVICDVEDCNWIVQMKGSSLLVWVRHGKG